MSTRFPVHRYGDVYPNCDTVDRLTPAAQQHTQSARGDRQEDVVHRCVARPRYMPDLLKAAPDERQSAVWPHDAVEAGNR